MGPIKKVFAKRLKPKFLASPAPDPQVEVGEPTDNGTSDDNDRDNDSFQWPLKPRQFLSNTIESADS